MKNKLIYFIGTLCCLLLLCSCAFSMESTDVQGTSNIAETSDAAQNQTQQPSNTDNEITESSPIRDTQTPQQSPETGISTEAPSSNPSRVPFGDGQLYAAAYLGYQEINNLDYYVHQYLSSSKLPVHYLSSGDYYLIIPRYSGMSLSILKNDINTLEPALIFEDPDCRPFIIQCNASDIFADAVIRLSYGSVKTEFSPFISLKDGSVETGADGLDITKPSGSGG